MPFKRNQSLTDAVGIGKSAYIPKEIDELIKSVRRIDALTDNRITSLFFVYKDEVKYYSVTCDVDPGVWKQKISPANYVRKIFKKTGFNKVVIDNYSDKNKKAGYTKFLLRLTPEYEPYAVNSTNYDVYGNPLYNFASLYPTSMGVKIVNPVQSKILQTCC